jgi:hypothetical protein
VAHVGSHGYVAARLLRRMTLSPHRGGLPARHSGASALAGSSTDGQIWGRSSVERLRGLLEQTTNRPPIVPETPIPIVPDDGLKRLFGVSAGNSFEARRDTALLILLLDTGARREEMVGLISTTSTWTWMYSWCLARAVVNGACRSGQGRGSARPVPARSSPAQARRADAAVDARTEVHVSRRPGDGAATDSVPFSLLPTYAAEMPQLLWAPGEA